MLILESGGALQTEELTIDGKKGERTNFVGTEEDLFKNDSSSRTRPEIFESYKILTFVKFVKL